MATRSDEAFSAAIALAKSGGSATDLTIAKQAYRRMVISEGALIAEITEKCAALDAAIVQVKETVRANYQRD